PGAPGVAEERHEVLEGDGQAVQRQIPEEREVDQTGDEHHVQPAVARQRRADPHPAGSVPLLLGGRLGEGRRQIGGHGGLLSRGEAPGGGRGPLGSGRQPPSLEIPSWSSARIWVPPLSYQRLISALNCSSDRAPARYLMRASVGIGPSVAPFSTAVCE